MKKADKNQHCPQISLLIDWYNDSKEKQGAHNYDAAEILDGVKYILQIANAENFTNQDCCMLFSMLSNYQFDFNVADVDTKNLLINVLLLKSSRFNPQDIANTLNALAKLDFKVTENLEIALLDSVEKNAAGFNPQGIANSLNALVKLDFKVTEKLKIILLKSVEKNAAGFNPQGIANSLNALAKLDFKVTENLKIILLNSVEKNAAGFNPQNITNTLNALAKLDLKVTEKLEIALLDSVEKNAAGFNPQGIANSLNALAKLDFELTENLEIALLNSIKKNAAGFNPQNIANTLNALAKLDFKVTEKLETDLLESVEKNVTTFNPQDIANTLNALAKLDFELTENLKIALLKSVEKNAAGFNQQNIANTLHALAKLNMLGHDVLFLLNKMDLKRLDCCDMIDALQVYSAFVDYCGLDKDRWASIAQCLSKSGVSLKSVEFKSKQRLKSSINNSKLQENVSIYLKQIYAETVEEMILYCHIVDLYVPSKKIVVEVNGPDHFNADGSFNLNTKYKQESLVKLGYKVINVNYNDWGNLKSDDDKINFLHNLLKTNTKPKIEKSTAESLRATAQPFTPKYALHKSHDKPTVALSATSRPFAPGLGSVNKF